MERIKILQIQRMIREVSSVTLMIRMRKTLMIFTNEREPVGESTEAWGTISCPIEMQLAGPRTLLRTIAKMRRNFISGFFVHAPMSN